MPKMTPEQKEELARQAFSDCEASFSQYLESHNVHLVYLDKVIMVVENDTNRVVRAATKDMLADFFKAEGIIGEHKNIKAAMLQIMSNATGMGFYPAYTEKKEFIEVEGNAGIKQWNTFYPNFYARCWYKGIRPLDHDPYMLPRLEEYFNLFFETPEAKKWFLHRLAATIRFPKRRLPTSLILHGVQGSGKDTLRIILERLLGKEHVATINGKAVQSDFNSYIPEKVIVFANEVFNWEKRQDVENVMKDYVTNDRITVNKKFIPDYTVDNFAFWIFATNHPEFTPFDENDRRYSYFSQSESLVMKYQLKYNCSEKEALAKYVNPLIAYIKDYDNADTNDEFYNLYCYLMSLDIDWDLISRPLWTIDKEGAIRAKFGRNIYYVRLRQVLNEFRKSALIMDVNSHKYVEHGKLFEAFNEGLPLDKRLETSHKFTIKCISMGLLLKPATKTISGKNAYYTEIISPILLKDVFEEKKKEEKKDYIGNITGEKKEEILNLEPEEDKTRVNPDYDG
jgi:hypothetical protein